MPSSQQLIQQLLQRSAALEVVPCGAEPLGGDAVLQQLPDLDPQPGQAAGIGAGHQKVEAKGPDSPLPPAILTPDP